MVLEKEYMNTWFIALIQTMFLISDMCFRYPWCVDLSSLQVPFKNINLSFLSVVYITLSTFTGNSLFCRHELDVENSHIMKWKYLEYVTENIGKGRKYIRRHVPLPLSQSLRSNSESSFHITLGVIDKLHSSRNV